MPDETTVREAVAAFNRFALQHADEPGEMVDEESGLSTSQLHIIRQIVEDAVPV